MHKRRSVLWKSCVLLSTLFAGTAAIQAQSDVTQPGDPVIASSSNSPGSEGVANAIDGQQTKYLNFDSRTPEPIKPSGFIVSPSVGVTRVTGMRIQSANDAPERDPKTVVLEGSNDPAVTSFGEGNWEPITTIDVPAFASRFQTQQFAFENFKAYRHYRWTVTETATANGCCMQVAEVELLGAILPPDVTTPGDPIVASSSNSPGSEGVANAIDNQQTKYLNFDSRTPEPIKPSGFVVSPSIGRTLVTGMTIQSANDAPERDPKLVVLEGSNDATVAGYNSGNWEPIVTNTVPAFTARFQTQTILFDNVRPYRHYRWTVVETTTANGCCMQVAEVELLGTGAPRDVTQPGDAMIASSSNSPGSEGVANAIDNQQTKYLNFDSRTPEPIKPSGFIVSPSIGASTVIGMSIQSANDAPERDPKTVTLEGSNDDTLTSFTSGTWEPIATVSVPAFTARFQVQEFYFPNQKSYKHYRWVVTETATANGCCMQVAEVELLAVPQGADCSKARFTLQPMDTPVLAGQPATFFAAVNGPWPVQWLRNGQPIPGATLTTYTTPAVTSANETNVYSLQIVGCEESTPVRAVVFTPSATKSLALSFVGGGANGAPTTISTNDVIGIFPQAYWNNSPNGTFDMPGVIETTDAEGNVTTTEYPLHMSDGAPSTITVSYASNGTWGSGTGVDSPTARMLNGIIYDNPGADPATVTFNNVPDGQHTVLVYGVSPPLQFQEIDYSVVGATTQTAYIRQMNSDEYNAAPGWYRGSSTNPNERTIANFVRFDGVRPDSAGTIVLNINEITTGYDRGTGPSGIQLILNSTPAGAPPAITAAPQATVAAVGGTARLSVTASGTGLTYQWRKNGRNIPNGGNISGANTANLVIEDFTEADAGVYSVAVFNQGGSVISKNAALSVSEFQINDRLVGYWKFDESSGTTVANSIAGGVRGDIVGNGTFGPGKVANALSLDGVSYVLITNYTKAKAAIAGSAWINIDPSTFTDVAIFRNAQGDLTVSGGAGRIVGQFEVGLAFDVETGTLRPMAAVGIGPNVARATGTNVVTTGAWHHIAFSADGAQLRVYLNGQEVAVADYLAEINPPDIQYISVGAQLDLGDPADPATLGPDFDTPDYLFGRIDELAVWTRSLSADEVSKIYAAGNQGQALTTVVIEPPADDVELNISRSGNNITISWEGAGFRLQSSATVEGGYTDVTGVTGTSHTITAQGVARFFRLVR